MAERMFTPAELATHYSANVDTQNTARNCFRRFARSDDARLLTWWQHPDRLLDILRVSSWNGKSKDTAKSYLCGVLKNLGCPAIIAVAPGSAVAQIAHQKRQADAACQANKDATPICVTHLSLAVQAARLQHRFGICRQGTALWLATYLRGCIRGGMMWYTTIVQSDAHIQAVCPGLELPETEEGIVMAVNVYLASGRKFESGLLVVRGDAPVVWIIARHKRSVSHCPVVTLTPVLSQLVRDTIAAEQISEPTPLLPYNDPRKPHRALEQLIGGDFINMLRAASTLGVPEHQTTLQIVGCHSANTRGWIYNAAGRQVLPLAQQIRRLPRPRFAAPQRDWPTTAQVQALLDQYFCCITGDTWDDVRVEMMTDEAPSSAGSSGPPSVASSEKTPLYPPGYTGEVCPHTMRSEADWRIYLQEHDECPCGGKHDISYFRSQLLALSSGSEVELPRVIPLPGSRKRSLDDTSDEPPPKRVCLDGPLYLSESQLLTIMMANDVDAARELLRGAGAQEGAVALTQRQLLQLLMAPDIETVHRLLRTMHF